jgi:hypothetical protein
MGVSTVRKGSIIVVQLLLLHACNRQKYASLFVGCLLASRFDVVLLPSTYCRFVVLLRRVSSSVVIDFVVVFAIIVLALRRGAKDGSFLNFEKFSCGRFERKISSHPVHWSCIDFLKDRE